MTGTPTPEQFACASRLGVSLAFANSPITIAVLVEKIVELEGRVAELEQQTRRRR